MTRGACSLLLVALIAVPVRGHFVWVTPDGDDTGRALVIFSDSLDPDAAVDVAKVAATKLWLRGPAGRETPLDWEKGEHAYRVRLPEKGEAVVGGVCQYGVVQRGQGKPFLLTYYPKYVRSEVRAATAWDRLPLEIVPQGAGRFRVLFAGQPVAGAEFAVLGPSPDDKGPLTTDDKGEVRVRTDAPGLYGLRARHVEARAGELAGQKYAEARHYATLVFRVAKATGGAP